MSWEIIISPTALEQLADITDRRVNKIVEKTIDKLENRPDKQGYPLTGDLAGYRSIRTVGQRFRVIYKVDYIQGVVYIFSLGIRKEGDKKDVYAIANKLIKAGLFAILFLLIIIDIYQ